MTAVLDLDGTAPPPRPWKYRFPVVGIRMPQHLAAFLREQAYVEGCSVNAWVVRLIERARSQGLPADCRDWLITQAAQCGHPGDPDAALITVLRHLADRWPDGARLTP